MRGLKDDFSTKQQFNDLILEVSQQHPQAVILLGCTELCVFDKIKNSINVLDVIAENI